MCSLISIILSTFAGNLQYIHYILYKKTYKKVDYNESVRIQTKAIHGFKNYSKELFMADLMAGIIVGIVALPLAIAFGIASGVSPEKGIITAIIAGFIISLMGGSEVQIGGPTGAFIVIIYGIIQQYGESGLIVATLMAGVLLILLGVFKLGAVIKFIPYPIIVGLQAVLPSPSSLRRLPTFSG